MTIDLHEAIFQAADGARQLGILAESSRRRVGELEAELESARQELGRLRAGAAPEEPADPVTYLLWSGRHEAWWGPDQRGYTTVLENAGRYGRAEALDCVLRSAQCGVREQVTSMVAAPDSWAGLSPVPVVLAVDPGVQVEQAGPPPLLDLINQYGKAAYDFGLGDAGASDEMTDIWNEINRAVRGRG